MEPISRRNVPNAMRKWIKAAFIAVCAYLVLAIVAGVVVGEGSLRLPRRPLRHRAEAEAEALRRYQAKLEDVSIQTADGTTLKAWYIHPRNFNGAAVILLHGITDNREGMAGFARLFLDHGYAVLMPDARRHGESGGTLATYGLRESDDLHRWVSWIYARDLSPQECVYGVGESYGAALMLEALPAEPRFCAVVVESPFSTAREMSYERVSAPLHLGPWFGHTLGRPVITSAVLYVRWRYGIDLLEPSPLAGVTHSNVPVLLIHGAADADISPRHSVILAKAAPDRVQLWLVPKAGHTMAWAAAHQEFEGRLLAWFSTHRRDTTKATASGTL
ncbi:MAG TPA: alpha/beta fold hydrolase [Candidatus Angelobacter sp.]|nr:alpha/beta fold hydrolase [Candidatus Angelobacter sp.]